VLKAEIVPGTTVDIVRVTDGDKTWQLANGQVTDEPPDPNKKARVHRDRVTSLVPLLKEKEYKLAPLDEVKVEGRPALGVKVSREGYPDVSLYFDKETGLLVKSGMRDKTAWMDKEGLQETVYQDYRELDFVSADEKVLKAAGIKVDGPGLLDFVRGQVPEAARLEKAQALIRQLGSDNFAEREQASKDLAAMGPFVKPLLQKAAKSSDPEVVRRAEECLEKLGEQTTAPIAAAAVRLLAVRQPDGSAEVLLKALSGADEALAREIKSALYALAQRKGGPDEALVKALQDKDPARKAAAEAALGKDGGAYEKAPGRRVYLPGIRQPMKISEYVDGKLLIRHEVLDAEYFNRFEDKVFAKP
jgi:hypothetical protein